MYISVYVYIKDRRMITYLRAFFTCLQERAHMYPRCQMGELSMDTAL